MQWIQFWLCVAPRRFHFLLTSWKIYSLIRLLLIVKRIYANIHCAMCPFILSFISPECQGNESVEINTRTTTMFGTHIIIIKIGSSKTICGRPVFCSVSLLPRSIYPFAAASAKMRPKYHYCQFSSTKLPQSSYMEMVSNFIVARRWHQRRPMLQSALTAKRVRKQQLIYCLCSAALYICIICKNGSTLLSSNIIMSIKCRIRRMIWYILC